MSSLCGKRGDTWTWKWTWVQKATGTPLDLTGCTARLQIRDSFSHELLYDTASEPGSTQIDIESGSVRVVVGASFSALIAPGSYSLDLQLTFPDATVLSSPTASLNVLEDMTHD